MNIGSYQFHASPTVLAVGAAGLCLLLSLGNWQLNRAAQKQHLQQQQQQLQGTVDVAVAVAVAVQNLSDSSLLQYKPVTLTGEPDNQHTFLLDNQPYQGMAGYHVITPVLLPNGDWILLNRGWVNRGRYRDQLPAIEPLPNPVSITGEVYLPSDKTLVLAADKLSDLWPKIIQKVDFAFTGQSLGVQFAPLTVRVSEDHFPLADADLLRKWPHVPPMGPDKHRAYALQWFGLAIAFAIIFVVANCKRREHDE